MIKKTIVGLVNSFLLLFAGTVGGQAQDAFVATWNFGEGDLSALHGEDMEYMEDGEVSTADLVQFGATDALGISPIKEEIANVIKIGKLDPDQGLIAPLTEDSNGGGDTINNWTAVMDVLIPSGSAGKKQSLIELVSDEFVAGAADAEFYIGANNGIGAVGLEYGSLTPEKWHRIVIVVNIEELWANFYIDGIKVGEVTFPDDSLDGRWSLDTLFDMKMTLFNDDNNESEEIFVNSIQIRYEPLNSGQVLALGTATAAGIPKKLPPVPSFVEQWVPGDVYANADTELSVTLNAGDTAITNDSISLSLNGESLATEITTDENVLTISATEMDALQTASKYELKLTYTDSAKGAQSESIQFEVPVYFENFDSVELGPNVDEQAVQSDAAWTAEGPAGWEVDRSGVPGNSEEHVGYQPDEDGDGFPDNDGVSEWAGWSFADYKWWVQVAGDQTRSQFTLAKNVVAVADPDEWDDSPHAPSADNQWYKTWMATPEIDVSGIPAGTLFARFHSSWRPEFDSDYHQEGYILVSYDGAEPVEMLTWVSDPNSENYHDHNQNEIVTVPLNNPDGASNAKLTFGMREAGNDWWWAIDNLVVNAGTVPPSIVTQPVGVEVNEGENFSLSVVASGGEPFSYQWYKNAVAIEGATSAEFSLAQAGVADAGKYSVKVSNEADEVLSSEVIVGVQASLGITIWTEDFEGLTLGPNVDEGLVGEEVWTKASPEGWSINDEEVPGTWAWQGLEDEEGNPENDGVTEWAGWSFADVKWWSETAGNQNRALFEKAIGTAAIVDGDEWDDQPREAGMMNTFMTTGPIPIDGIMENSLVFRFHSSWRPDACCGGSQKAVVEVSFDDGELEEILRWESDSGSEFFHADSENETVNLVLNNPKGAETVQFTFSYLDAANNWWWAIDNLILAGEPEPIFAENFDSLELGPFVSDSESGGDGTDWTSETPTGWVMNRGDGHGPTGDDDAVTEFDGWTFLDPVSWNATAGQDRDQFTKGSGVVAVGDSDEYDDKADAKFNASLSTPEFSLEGVSPGTAILVYDSSWRQEPQQGTVSVSFDGGEPITLLTLTPDSPTAYNETVTLPLGNPEGAKTAVITWDHQGHNNWWWAIDNIKVTVGKAPAGIVTQLTSVEATEGEGVVFQVEANGDEPLYYKWFKGGVEISGIDGPVLELSNISEADAGAYTVEVSNSAGSATSNPAQLAVLLKPGSTLVFAEDFDSLELGPFVSDSESGGDGTDWTASVPDGWAMNPADDHGPTAGGDDVVEFDGWTFFDPVSWNATAGQNRDAFTKGTGAIAVADSDEYDDKADAKFNAALATPSISIAGIKAGSLILKYDSSWRQEPQQGKVTVSYDGGEPVALLVFGPDTPTGYNDTVTVRMDNPEGASSVVIAWDHQGHNNWWWAIDNIEVTGELQPIFAENFDSLELGPFVSDSESGGDGTDWTATAPTGWVMALGEDHGPTAGGDDVVEFDGWTFLDPVSWNATAGQDRALFTKGSGAIAVADSDEYDDKADAKFNASLSTPPINIADAGANQLLLVYDSSWRQEPQRGTVSVSYDGAAPVVLLELTPDTPTAYNDTVELELNNPEGAKSVVITWDHQGHNNWWWAIDNIAVKSKPPGPGPNDPAVAADKAVYLSGEPITVAFKNGEGNPKDWVGIYGPDMVPGDVGSIVWSYVSGTKTAGEGLTEGSMTFADGLPAGEYVARFFINDGYTQMANTKFAVVDPPGITTSKARYSVGDAITVNFSNGPGNAKDWVGLYRPDMTPGDVGSLKWAYVSGTNTAGEPKTDGSVVFAEGLESGEYVAIFFENDGYTQLAKTAFSVAAEEPLPEGIYFVEDFDGLALGPFVSDSESGGDGTDWTATPPADWVMALGDAHGPTAGGDDVVEFDGWTFLDPVSWNATAGQDRAMFTKGSGVIAVADSDEYDDKADAKLDASLSTPSIDIAGAAAGSLFLAYDSSWRQEPQQGKVMVSYDGGEPVVLLELTPDTPTGYDDTVVLALQNPEGASKAVIMWDHQGHNNWWWAIDNIIVGTEEAITDGGEAPAITSITVDGGVLTIAWSGAEGLRLQRAVTVTGPWEDVDGTVGKESHSEASDQAAAFYRLVK